MNELKQQVLQCLCPSCRAINRLLHQGADLRFSPSKAGRLCELAAVAAAGSAGLAAASVVQARREYAKHIGVELRGPISNADQPVHIQHAATNSNHNPQARNRIHLGTAQASLVGGVYFLR